MNLEVLRRRATRTRFRPVVFVHGGFHAAWIWDEHFLPHFSSRGFDAHALSLRGHGNSAGKERIDAWGLDDYCEDVHQVCQDLRSLPILVGHSIGAVIAQRYVQSHPAAAMVMIAPTPLAKMTLAKLRWAARFPLRTAKMLITRDMNHALPAYRSLLFSDDVGEEQIAQYMGRLERESNRVFQDISRICDPNPRGIRIPCLIVAAAKDRVPQAVNERLAQAFRAELQTLSVAHDVMLCPQWQTAADRIIEWLMQLGPAVAAA